MRQIGFFLLYMGLALGANAARADMRAMMLHEAPAPVVEAAFSDPDGVEVTLADYAGQFLVVNFWATWCAPCREEMPSLEALQEIMGEEARVILIASGRNPQPAIDRFFAEEGITDLRSHLDPRMTAARAMGVFGLPVTVLINAEGEEVGRLRGGADWAGEEAVALIRRLAAE